MPLLKLDVSTPVSPAQKEMILKAASRLVAEKTGKPESYVMVTLSECAGLFAGQPGAVAFADVRGIGGLDRKTNAALTRAIGDLLQKELGMARERIYVTVTDVPATNWGWKDSTFG